MKSKILIEAKIASLESTKKNLQGRLYTENSPVIANTIYTVLIAVIAQISILQWALEPE